MKETLAHFLVPVRRPVKALELIVKRRVLRWISSGRSPRSPARFVVLPGDTVSDEVIVSGLYEETLLAALFERVVASRREDFSKGTAIDIGANIGNHTVHFSRYFRRTIAFEPNPTTLAILRCNVALSARGRIDVIPVGLGNAHGSFPFVEDCSGNLGGSGFAFAGIEAVPTTECAVRRGDEVLTDELVDGELALIKIDVEGGELAVLEGLTQVLSRHDPIILFESNRPDGPHGGNAVIEHLRGVGYRYFLALDDGSSCSKWRRLLGAMLTGDRVRVARIERLQARRYPLILASRHDLV